MTIDEIFFMLGIIIVLASFIWKVVLTMRLGEDPDVWRSIVSWMTLMFGWAMLIITVMLYNHVLLYSIMLTFCNLLVLTGSLFLFADLLYIGFLTPMREAGRSRQVDSFGIASMFGGDSRSRNGRQR